MKLILCILLAGGIGSLCRFGLGNWMARALPQAAWPWGTILVNSLGCLLFGLVYAWFQQRGMLGSLWCRLLLVGFLAAFTTFSTFAFQAVEMLQKGQYLACCGYLVGQCLVGVLAVVAGLRLAD